MKLYTRQIKGADNRDDDLSVLVDEQDIQDIVYSSNQILPSFASPFSYLAVKVCAQRSERTKDHLSWNRFGLNEHHTGKMSKA